MKLSIQLTEHVTLKRVHVVEIDTEQYPTLRNTHGLTTMSMIEHHTGDIKDSNGKPLIDILSQSPGVEEIEDCFYECVVEEDK